MIRTMGVKKAKLYEKYRLPYANEAVNDLLERIGPVETVADIGLVRVNWPGSWPKEARKSNFSNPHSVATMAELKSKINPTPVDTSPSCATL